MTLSVKQINALQPLKPPQHPSYPLHTALIRSVPALFPPATVYGLYASLYMHFWWRRWIRLSLSVSISPTALPSSPPICLTFRQSLLSVALLSSLYCQASGGSHLKITRPGHTQPSLNACQFTHGKGITRLLLGSCKLLLMAMQIIRVRLAPPANLSFMWVHS